MSTSSVERKQTLYESSSSRAFLVVVLGILSGLGPLSIDMYLPAFPAVTSELGATSAQVQLTLTSFTFGLAFGQMAAGPLSDRIGRKPPLVAGLLLFAVAGFFASISPNATMLAAVRFAQGVGAATGVVIARAVVRDLCSGARMAQMFSLLLLVNETAPIVGPVIGAELLRVTSWRGIFAVITAIGAATAMTVWPGLRETAAPSLTRATMRSNLRHLVRDKRFVAYAAASALPFATLFAYISGAPFVLQDDYGLTAQQFGVVFAINSLGILLAGLLNSRLLKQFSTRVLLIAALVVTTLGGLGVLISPVTPVPLICLLAGFFLAAAGIGITFPNATTLAMDSHPGRAGTASAFLGALQFFAGGLAAPLVGLSSPEPTILVAVVMLVPAAFALFISLRMRPVS